MRLAREARDLLHELRAVLRRPTRADSVRALRALFDLPEDQVERLCQDMTYQDVGALQDVFTCDRCGGPRRVVACVFSATIAARILDHLGIPSRPLPLARAQDPPQLPLYA